MTSFSDIKGQKNAVRFLSNCLLKNRASGSYLFTGPSGTGRALTAKAFIMALFCSNNAGAAEPCGKCVSCLKIEKRQHPDMFWVAPEKNKNIKIEEVRDICAGFCLKPYESNFNVCVMEEAHMMTREASNAFLKMLEQPPARSLFILITDKKELLLPTVLSRCIEVRFSSLSVGDTVDIIRDSADLEEKEAYFLAHFSQGSPGAALQMINEDVSERKQKIMEMLARIAGEDNYDCLSWDKEGRDYLLEDIEMLIMFFREIAMGRENLGNVMFEKNIQDTAMYQFFGKYPIEKIYGIMERLINIKLALGGNVNSKLVAQILPRAVRGK